MELGENRADRRHRELLEAGEKARLDAIERSNTREMKLKRSADILKGCLYKMPDNPMEIPVFFDYADRHFNSNHIDETLRISLINPYLSDKARKLATRLAP